MCRTNAWEWRCVFQAKWYNIQKCRWRVKKFRVFKEYHKVKSFVALNCLHSVATFFVYNFYLNSQYDLKHIVLKTSLWQPRTSVCYSWLLNIEYYGTSRRCLVAILTDLQAIIGILILLPCSISGLKSFSGLWQMHLALKEWKLDFQTEFSMSKIFCWSVS